MTEEDVEVSREHGERGFEVEMDGLTYRIRLVASDPVAYDRFYNLIANPLLWFIQHYLWDLSNVPGHPPDRAARPGPTATSG